MAAMGYMLASTAIAFFVAAFGLLFYLWEVKSSPSHLSFAMWLLFILAFPVFIAGFALLIIA